MLLNSKQRSNHFRTWKVFGLKTWKTIKIVNSRSLEVSFFRFHLVEFHLRNVVCLRFVTNEKEKSRFHCQIFDPFLLELDGRQVDSKSFLNWSPAASDNPRNHPRFLFILIFIYKLKFNNVFLLPLVGFCDGKNSFYGFSCGLETTE